MPRVLLVRSQKETRVPVDRYSQQLPGGVTVRRSYVAGEPRIELVNALPLADQLVAVGCFTEIIQWRKRVFIPTGR
ncbi:MAG: hypothetical protein MET45_27620 [Nostoc sp. LLA-1]|nr:hypothetical protein [Cyanocohniella sp. LLY]